MHAPASEWPDLAADLLERLRDRQPRVHCITNAVAQNFTANVLLAAGAIPSMTISPDEIAAFAARADALLVNLGTFDVERQTAAETAIAQVNRLERPWVLDPVLIDRSPPRADFARDLAARAPAAIRLNAARVRGARRHLLDRGLCARPRHHPGADRRRRSGHRRQEHAAHPQRPSADGARHRHGLRRGRH